MGKKLRDEDLVLNVVINGDLAKKELGDLEQSTRELTSTNKDLRAEKEKLKRAGKQESDRYKEITAELKANNATLKTNEARMKELRSEMGVTGMTMVQLRKEAKRLQLLLDNATLGTDNWKKYRAELDKVEAQMGIVKAKSKGLSATFGKIADGFNRFSVMGAAVVATLTGIVFSVKEWVNGMVKLDDQLSDIMKTTGLTKKGVRELNGEFRNLNTRTTREELRGLAEEAGRLGKQSKQDIMDFVDVGNQITVALGDDLGDAKTAVKEVGKLTNIYKVGTQYGTGFKDSMMKVGSAINEVSANSSAQADYLIGYLKRMGGVAGQADINASQILGYASALDQLGQTQEMAATAQGKVMIDMFTDQAKYAEIAKMSMSDFTTLLKTDANEAFLKVLEGLNGNSEGLSVMATKLDELGVDGARAVQVLSTLASNTKLVRSEQDIANKAMIEGVSLTKEYTTKNESFAGSISKISQFVHSKLINSTFLGWIESIAGKMAEWVKVPVSKTLTEQAKKVNLLTMEMTEANTSTKRQKEIYDELKEINPSLVSGIDAQSLSMSKLRENVEKYNEEMVKRIALENLREEEKTKLNDQATALEELWKTQSYLDEQMLSINKDLALSDGTRLERYEKIKQHLFDITKENGNLRMPGTDEADQMAELNKTYSKLKRNAKDYKELTAETFDFSKKILAFEKEMNLNTKEDPNSGKGGEDDSGGESGLRNNTVDESIVAEKKLNEAIKSIREQLRFSKLTDDEKEIAQVEEKYKKLIDDAKANGIDTKDIESLKQEELTALAAKHEEKRKTAKEEALKVLQDATMSADEKEKQQSIEKYQNMLALAEQYGFDTTEMYLQLKAELDAIMNGGSEDGENDGATGVFFGMSGDELDSFLEKMEEVIEYASALRDGLDSVFTIANNADQKKFNKEKKRADDRKKLLKNQLDNGVISQESYSKSIEKIDADLEKKQEELDKKKAKREKIMGVLNVGINTATGIMKAVAASPLTGGMPWTAIIAMLGALQMGAVLSAPGLEEGGFTDVVRAQDGKKFRAQQRSKRGFVDKPSVLVGEGDPEFVANGAAVKNPTVKPFLDIIDYHQRSGNIHNLDLPAVIGTMPSMRGYETGGYTKAETSPSYSESSNNNSLTDLIQQSNATTQELNAILKKGVRAIVIYGDIEDKMEEVETIRNAVNM